MKAICEIPDAPGYAVDEGGNVFTQWRLERVKGLRGLRAIRGTEWLPKTAFLHPTGYRCVWLRGHKSKRAATRLVHRLVLEAFVGPCPDGMECRHIDGDRSNNALSNLCWGTKLENEADKDRHGKRPRGKAWYTEKRLKAVARGEQNGFATLTSERVLAIRADRSAGLTYLQIATKHGVSASHACMIVKRKVWKHL